MGTTWWYIRSRKSIRSEGFRPTNLFSPGLRTKSRSLSASRARQTAAGKKKRGTPFGMTRNFRFQQAVKSRLRVRPVVGDR